ncbi:Rho GTPase-activating protein 26 [Willisornis vidua]|uniref:Rho GTPase-activating protein 26 n=1 Tax=Willisornis vidua TaxID=1566151 RepID=A0ABQ9CXG8_9PASS|nr:Rho GTPase-activating protein 26 [Willisornis vidua]
MGLHPLEFSDCYLDSPWFRERVRAHEAELEKTNKFIKELLKDGKNLIAATKSGFFQCHENKVKYDWSTLGCIKRCVSSRWREVTQPLCSALCAHVAEKASGTLACSDLSAAQRKFAHSLRDFKFEFIGDAETDDERYIDQVTTFAFENVMRVSIEDFIEAMQAALLLCKTSLIVSGKGSRNLEDLPLPAAGGGESKRSIECWSIVLSIKVQCIGGVWGSSFSHTTCIPPFCEKGRSGNLDGVIFVEQHWLALSVTETLIKPLERFRKEQLGAVKEEKKKFDKETEKNYSLLEKHLNLSAKKKELQLQELSANGFETSLDVLCVQADNQVEQNRKHFYELSLEYVCKLQEIQERKKFECVEPVLSFFQGLFTFYHQGYELAKDFNHYKMALQINIQNTRNRFEGTRSEVEELMNKIRRNPQEHKRANNFTMEGYLYVQEKRPAPFGSSWVKHYCMYKKETKKFIMIPFEHRSGGKVGDEELFVLTYCTKRNTDTIDRRFCFDLEASDRPGVPVTMQAFSEEDRKLWMEALDGKEALFINLNKANAKREGSAQLDKIGFTIIKKCISAVETRGINDQGLYRVVGVSSKVQRLLSLLMDAKTCNEVDLENSVDWEVKTITSAMKQYLRYLFLYPIESGSPESRVNAVHFLVHKLPEKNKEMLEILVKHLANVSKHAKSNLMTVANLGVVFGPTLMRPQEETVAAIMDLKFQNIVVEILIENHEKIFKTLPDATFPEPISMSVSPPNAPPRQSRRQGQRIKRPLAVYNLCLELDDADSHSSPREDTPTGSMDSLSSQSPTPAFSSSPPGLLDGNHLIMDSGDLAGWTTNLTMPYAGASLQTSQAYPYSAGFAESGQSLLFCLEVPYIICMITSSFKS